MSKSRVFVDTNIILEAFRTNCWTALCDRFKIETVEKCIEEALTGNQLNPRYIPVDGELHLFAWLNSHESLPDALILISTADKAAIISTERLGWIDSVVSLEKLLERSGITKAQMNNIARHFRDEWLNDIKLKIRFGILG